MSNEDLKLAAEEARIIAEVAKKTGLGKPVVLTSKESRDATPELLELMDEHGLGIGLHKGINAPDVKSVSNGYVREVKDTGKAFEIMDSAEKAYTAANMARNKAAKNYVSSR